MPTDPRFRAHFRMKREIRNVLRRDTRLSRAGGQIADVMLGHVNVETGSTWIGVHALARLTNATTRTVKTWRKRLVEFGYFTLEKKGGGRAVTNHYRPVFPPPELPETVKSGAGKGEKPRQKTVKQASPDNMKGFDKEIAAALAGASEAHHRRTGILGDVSEAAKRSALETLMTADSALSLDALVEHYGKRRAALAKRGRPYGSIDEGFQYYVRKAIEHEANEAVRSSSCRPPSL